MSPRGAALAAVAAIAAALVGLAYAVAPRACQGGLEIYFWTGVVAVLLLAALPFIAMLGRSLMWRVAIAVAFVALGIAVWLGALLAANVRFICGMGYL